MNYFSIVAIILSGLSFIGVFYLALSSRGELKQLRNKVEEAESATSTAIETNKGLSMGAISLSERIVKLERDLVNVHEEIERVSMQEPDNRAFTHAIKLAGKGANVDELIETCELSEGEAELIVLLHSQRKDTPEPTVVPSEERLVEEH